jgi:hypothetical protein
LIKNSFIFFLLLEIDDESITSEDEDESSMQMEESKIDTEKQKADALKKQIGKFNNKKKKVYSISN